WGDGKQPRSDRDRRSPARAAGAQLERVGVAGGATRERLRVAGEAELGRRRGSEAHGARFVEHERELVAVLGHVAGERPRPEGAFTARAGHEILVGEREPPQGEGARQRVDGRGPAAGGFRVDDGEGAELRVEALDAGEVVLGQLERGHLAPTQPLHLLDGGQVVQLEHPSSVRLDNRIPTWLLNYLSN